MQKRFIKFAVIFMVVVFIFTGCSKSDIPFTNYNKDYEIGFFYISKSFPAVIVSTESELKAFSDEYRKYIDFKSASYGTKSIDEAFERYNSIFFKINRLILQLKENGAPAGKHDVEISNENGVITVTIKYVPNYGPATAANILSLFVLELPNSEKCNSVNFII